MQLFDLHLDTHAETPFFRLPGQNADVDFNGTALVWRCGKLMDLRLFGVLAAHFGLSNDQHAYMFARDWLRVVLL